jgi:hypothetical protein
MSRDLNYRIRHNNYLGGGCGIDGGAKPQQFTIGKNLKKQEEEIKVDKINNVENIDDEYETVLQNINSIEKNKDIDDYIVENYIDDIKMQYNKEPVSPISTYEQENGETDNMNDKIEEDIKALDTISNNSNVYQEPNLHINRDTGDNTKTIFRKMSDKLFDLFEFKTRKEQTTFMIFILPPIVISLISAWHVQALFALVNPWFLSWILAFAFELAALASLFSLKMLSRVNGKLIWLLIFIIIFMQGLGNTYAAFIALDINNQLVVKLLQLLSFDALFGGSIITAMKVTAAILGGSLPVIAFLFIKSITQYLDNDNSEDIVQQLQNIADKQSTVEQ